MATKDGATYPKREIVKPKPTKTPKTVKEVVTEEAPIANDGE